MMLLINNIILIYLLILGPDFLHTNDVSQLRNMPLLHNLLIQLSLPLIIQSLEHLIQLVLVLPHRLLHVPIILVVHSFDIFVVLECTSGCPSA